MKTANEATSSQNGHATAQNGVGRYRLRVRNLFSPARTMRKISCPHCAVVNLEEFVTYPHCAGCGALLKKETPTRGPVIAWRRPLGPILWATVLCCAAAAAVGAAMMLRRPAVAGQMVVYGQAVRNVEVRGLMSLSLSLDTIGGAARDSSILKGVSIRLDKNFLQNFALLKITPPALEQKTLGSGHYFFFAPMPRETPITFDFKALNAGRHRLQAGINADAQLPTDYLAFITVQPKKTD